MKTKICVAAVVLLATAGCPTSPGPDPRAVAIEYALIENNGPFGGDVRITGVVRNRGTLPFLSGEGQQTVQLYEGDTMVAEQEFTNLGVGESVEVDYERAWSTLDAFRPEEYTVVIAYDPEILNDGNENNDDVNLDNNERSRSTEALDEFFD